MQPIVLAPQQRAANSCPRNATQSSSDHSSLSATALTLLHFCKALKHHAPSMRAATDSIRIPRSDAKKAGTAPRHDGRRHSTAFTEDPHPRQRDGHARGPRARDVKSSRAGHQERREGGGPDGRLPKKFEGDARAQQRRGQDLAGVHRRAAVNAGSSSRSSARPS